MDLFLDTTFKSFFLELLGDYLQLVKGKKVKPIKLSASTLNLVSEKEISFPALPLLVENNGQKLVSPLSIALSFLDATFTKDLLIGSHKEDLLAVILKKLFSSFRHLEYLSYLKERNLQILLT
jgi:hypothetical protein